MVSKYLFFLFFIICISSVWSACNPNTSCKCPKGLKQGQYCGGQLKTGCTKTDSVFECSPSGDTCEYGFRKTCSECGDTKCPPPPPPRPPRPIPSCHIARRDPKILC